MLRSTLYATTALLSVGLAFAGNNALLGRRTA